MCGITGIWAFNEVGRFQLTNLAKSTASLSHRGPDDQGVYHDHFVGLGHRRLSIIDTSSQGHQPMSSSDGRYHIVFNGEIYNFQEIKKELLHYGADFVSETDTEVLLQLFIHKGKKCLDDLNGFFAFAIYDSAQNRLFIARDRIGIKPLLYFQDDFKFLFASEMQAILAFGLDVAIDHNALNYYLQLNYTPAPLTMVKGVKKLMPGEYIDILDGEVIKGKYYGLPDRAENSELSYDQAKDQLKEALHESVKKRMIADVPLGCFLSGGIDSSVITALASEQTQHLSTFSIGFEGAKFFDETSYAELVAKKFQTNHTTFRLSNDEIFYELDHIVHHFDEPFADSSAIPVYILSKKTRDHITVALSGDGADEIFSGYNKHSAWWQIENSARFKSFVKHISTFAKILPKSRSGKLSNYMRQTVKFAEAMKLSPADRYWFLASISHEKDVNKLLVNSEFDHDFKRDWLGDLENYQNMNDLLRADTQFLLPNDMLKKVDVMSMATSLEVRVPFLDHGLVDFVFSLQENFKIDGAMRKRVLQDAFRDILPKELYMRPKKGFEMPLLNWLKTSLKSELKEELFNQEKIIHQGFFNWKQVAKLQKRLHSINPGDSHAQVWALYVFQKWYDRIS